MFSSGIERALRVALEAHAGQTRKTADACPYVVHPLHVAIMLARFGLEEETIEAGVLHDVVEDCPGWTIERIESEFGPRVAAIVGELTEDKSRSWDERKQWAIDHVPHMSPQAASVKAADKLHNLHSLLAELRATPDHDKVWSKFRGGREKTLKMSRALVDALSARIEPRLSRALNAVMKSLEEQALRAPATPTSK